MNFTCLLAGCLLAGPVGAGAAPLPPDSTAIPHREFMTTLSYGSNLAYFGRTQARAFPYFSTAFDYTTKGGLFASAELFNLLHTPDLLDETDLSLGWIGDLSPSVDASVSYSRFIFASGSELVKASVNNSLNAHLGQDWGPFYTRLSGNYLYGGSSGRGDGFLTFENSRYMEIPHVFTPNAFISIEPLVSVAAGTQSFAETSLTKRYVLGKRTRTSTTSRKFSIVDYELALPVTYTLGKVSVAAAWRYIIPVNLPADDQDSHKLSIWTFGVSLTL